MTTTVTDIYTIVHDDNTVDTILMVRIEDEDKNGIIDFVRDKREEFSESTKHIVDKIRGRQ